MMLASFSALLGTTWWSILVFVTGFGFGVFLSNKVKSLLNR
jgi:hypothetical protein